MKTTTFLKLYGACVASGMEKRQAVKFAITRLNMIGNSSFDVVNRQWTNAERAARQLHLDNWKNVYRTARWYDIANRPTR